jgi:hypothetical protein
VYLDYYNISDIQPDAFAGLRDLSVLYLNNNEIQKLHQSTFQHMRTLTKLDVSFNRLGYIHPETFVDMKFFYNLNVSHNVLVLNGTILYSNYINILDVAFCNPAKDASWYVLKHPVFSGLPNLTKLMLEGNAIHCVMWDTFINNRRLTSLDLKNNMLKLMSHQLTLCSHVIDLDLSNNPLDCNCHMKIFAVSYCKNGVKLDELSCGTLRGLEHLPCDDMSLTDPNTGICDFNVGSTYAVTSTLLTSEVTSQDNTTSAVFSTTPETTTSFLYSDQHSSTSVRNTSSENARFVKLSSTPTTEVPSTIRQNPNVNVIKASVTKSSLWIVIGVVFVIVVIIVVVSVVVILRVCKRQDFDGSVPPTHYFKLSFGNGNPETNNKGDDNYKRFQYISLGSLQERIGPKQDLHYLCSDVTTVPGECAQEKPESGSCCCSKKKKKNTDTDCENGDLEDHVYEEVI